MKLIRLVERACARLQEAGVSFGHGTTHAFDEAVWLTLWRLGLPLPELDAVANFELNSTQVRQVEALIEQRIATRQPAAYLTGEAWLQGVPFDIDASAIVPRSFIAEVLAAGTLHTWMSARNARVLDLCTGNGSLAVLAARAWPQAHVVASDISATALAVAQRNLQRHGLQERIELIECDGLPAMGARFDLILCNPPYVNARAMAALPAEYRAEPALALAGGADGMDFIRPLMARVRTH